MKKALFIVVLSFCFCLFGYTQTPILKLTNTVQSNVELPQSLNKNDICLIYEENGGWSPYDFVTYYFLKESGKIEVYKEERPKSYLKNKSNLKSTISKIENSKGIGKKITDLINSQPFEELLKYSQEDFKKEGKGNVESKQTSPPCVITDAAGFKVVVIQNNKEKSYEYYAPQYYYEKCNDKSINKPVLKKFLDVLVLFK